MPASLGSKSRSIGAYVMVVEAAVPFEMLVLTTRRHNPECYNFVTECM